MVILNRIILQPLLGDLYAVSPHLLYTPKLSGLKLKSSGFFQKIEEKAEVRDGKRSSSLPEDREGFVRGDPGGLVSLGGVKATLLRAVESRKVLFLGKEQLGFR
jgi:hypothetical protein